MEEMKRICLIGASGYVGSAILKEALGRGYKVNSIIRDCGKLLIRHPNMRVSVVDVMDTDALARKMSGADVIISAYNPGWFDPELGKNTRDGNLSILKAAHKSGIPRLLIVGGSGSLEVSPGVRLMDTDELPAVIMPGVRSLASIYSDCLLSEEQIDWVFFCPPKDLEPGVRTGNYRMGKDKLIRDQEGNSRISLEDYAMTMIDEVETELHHRERITIGY